MTAKRDLSSLNSNLDDESLMFGDSSELDLILDHSERGVEDDPTDELCGNLCDIEDEEETISIKFVSPPPPSSQKRESIDAHSSYNNQQDQIEQLLGTIEIDENNSPWVVGEKLKNLLDDRLRRRNSGALSLNPVIRAHQNHIDRVLNALPL